MISAWFLSECRRCGMATRVQGSPWGQGMDGTARAVIHRFPDEHGFETFVQFPPVENGATGWETLLTVAGHIAKLAVLLVAGDAAAVTMDIRRRLTASCRFPPE